MRFTSNPFLPNSLEPKKWSKKEGGTVSWEISPVFFIRYGRYGRRDIVSEFPWKRWKILGTDTVRSEDIGRSVGWVKFFSFPRGRVIY